MQYINSDKITVFPSAFRGSPYYKSRLTSEENLTLLGKYSRNGNAVIRDGDYTIITLEGYVFKMLTTDVPKGNSLFAIIYIKEENSIKHLSKVPKTGEGETLDDDTGGGGIFHGLAFGTQAEGNDHTASVRVRDASGNISYTKEDESSKTYDASMAVVTDDSGHLTTKSLATNKSSSKSSAVSGFMKSVSLSQDAFGQITSLSTSFGFPEPKDLTSTGYAVGRILGIGGDGALAWQAPSTSAGANDGNFTVNGTKIWSANSSSSGGLSFSADHFTTTYNNGVATVKLKNSGGGGSTVTPNNGELQINGNVIFRANQSGNSNILLDNNYFTYADYKVSLDVSKIQAAVSGDVNDGDLYINTSGLPKNKIFSANQKGQTILKFDTDYFDFNGDAKQVSLNIDGLKTQLSINDAALKIQAKNSAGEVVDRELFTANSDTDRQLTFSLRDFEINIDPLDTTGNTFVLKLQNDYLSALKAPDTQGVLSYVQYPKGGGITTDIIALANLGVAGEPTFKSLTLTSENDKAGSLNIGVGVRGGIVASSMLYGGLASIYVGSNDMAQAGEACITMQANNNSGIEKATLSVTKTSKYDTGTIKRAGVFITPEDIKLMGRVTTGTGLGDLTTRISLTVDSGIINCVELTQSSDARLKENLQRFFEPKKSILNLPVYTYNFIGRDEKMLGCLAQDLQEICPEIVNEDMNGYLSIQESKIVYLLLEEVKKLRTELDLLNMKQEIN